MVVNKVRTILFLVLTDIILRQVVHLVSTIYCGIERGKVGKSIRIVESLSCRLKVELLEMLTWLR